MNVRVRYAVIIVVAVAAGLAAACLVVWAVLTAAIRDAAEAPLAYRLGEVARTVEARLDMGLPLGFLRDVQERLEAAKASNREIVAFEIFDAAGTTVFSTDRGTIGEPVPAPWQLAGAAGETGAWTVRDGTFLVLGTDIVNAFGQIEGGVALSYSTGAMDARLARLNLTLLAALGALLALTVALAGPAVMLSLGRLRHDVEQARTALGDLDPHRAPTGAPTDRALLPEAARLHAAGRRALSDLAHAGRELQAIDDAL